MARHTVSVVALKAALASTGGFIMPAAKLLGIARNTMYRRMRGLDLCAVARAMRLASGWRIGTSRRLDPDAQLARLTAIDQATLTPVERKRIYWRCWYWRQKKAA